MFPSSIEEELLFDLRGRLEYILQNGRVSILDSSEWDEGCVAEASESELTCEFNPFLVDPGCTAVPSLGLPIKTFHRTYALDMVFTEPLLLDYTSSFFISSLSPRFG